MESLQNIKRRLKGTQNIGKITKAMELVAATKMRRSQEIALASRPYAFAALDFLANISRLEDVSIPPLLEKREIERTAYMLVTSDKGLAGSFNSAMIRAFEAYLREQKLSVSEMKNRDSFIAVGQKAAKYLGKNFELAGKFVRVGDYTSVEEVRPIADLLVEGFLNNGWDRVIVFSTHFRSALRQEAIKRKVLPVDFEHIKRTIAEIAPETGKFSELKKAAEEEKKPADYLIEPSPEAVLESLAYHLILMEIYHLILEANASEHAARRAAMKNASDNAVDLASALSLEYNKSRQAAITREIIEVTSGAESLK